MQIIESVQALAAHVPYFEAHAIWATALAGTTFALIRGDR